jgi:hypothetical protein
MRRPSLRWLGWTAFGLSLLAAAYVLLALLCRYRAGLPFRPGLDPFCAALPLKDWTGFLSGGYIVFLVCFYLYWLAREPNRVPYLVVATGVLMLVRDLFLLLTPVAALPGLMPLYQGGVVSGIHGTLLYDQELFFSGHAGVPFLYFLLCLEDKPAALVCIAVALLNAAGVLLTRNHYSIDVLGAFFIVPTIVLITRGLFGGLDQEFRRCSGVSGHT